MKDRIIKIADFLDSIGRESDADFLDGLVGNPDSSPTEPAEEIIIPDDEMEMLQMVFDSLKKSLET